MGAQMTRVVTEQESLREHCTSGVATVVREGVGTVIQADQSTAGLEVVQEGNEKFPQVEARLRQGLSNELSEVATEVRKDLQRELSRIEKQVADLILNINADQQNQQERSMAREKLLTSTIQERHDKSRSEFEDLRKELKQLAVQLRDEMALVSTEEASESPLKKSKAFEDLRRDVSALQQKLPNAPGEADWEVLTATARSAAAAAADKELKRRYGEVTQAHSLEERLRILEERDRGAAIARASVTVAPGDQGAFQQWWHR